MVPDPQVQFYQYPKTLLAQFDSSRIPQAQSLQRHETAKRGSLYIFFTCLDIQNTHHLNRELLIPFGSESFLLSLRFVNFLVVEREHHVGIRFAYESNRIDSVYLFPTTLKKLNENLPPRSTPLILWPSRRSTRSTPMSCLHN